MLEIDEKVPFYICSKKTDGKCVLNENNECFEECNHISIPVHAKHKNAVVLFEKFCDTFNLVIDDYGRLVCTEKEK